MLFGGWLLLASYVLVFPLMIALGVAGLIYLVLAPGDVLRSLKSWLR